VKRTALNLVLILLLVFAGVKIWYGRLEEGLRVPTVPPEPRVADSTATTPGEIMPTARDYTIIVDRNIFQAVIEETEPEVTQPAPQELEQTKLKLSLMGTVSGTERDSRAIITDDTKRQQDIYHIGDSIQGALIKDIERGRVILEVKGVDEVLTLADRKGGGPAYEPSPADFYQEPVEQPLPQEPELEPETEQEMQQPRQPVVRPRPFRRPGIQRRPADQVLERPQSGQEEMEEGSGDEQMNMQDKGLVPTPYSGDQ
jgi:type II secretion system protein C